MMMLLELALTVQMRLRDLGSLMPLLGHQHQRVGALSCLEAAALVGRR